MIFLDGVSVTYPGGTVGLKPTTITFRPTEVTVLLGLSGAGKSTLLRALNHLAVPTAGTVSLADGASLSDPRVLRAHRRRTAMIFQQHQLISRYTALQNVLIGRLGRYPGWRTLAPFPAEDRRLAMECLDRVGLLHKALDRVDALSGGQQQRVGIARALAQQPQLILADEPVASLDPATSRRVLSQLKRICEEDSIPAIVSLHQIDMARDFAHRIVGLRDGEVIFDASPDELQDFVLNRIYGDAQAAGEEPHQHAGDTTEPQMEAYA